MYLYRDLNIRYMTKRKGEGGGDLLKNTFNVVEGGEEEEHEQEGKKKVVGKHPFSSLI